MTLLLCRVDDRLIHGQVVIGWGGALRADHVVLVDDAVAGQAWEQEIYRMALPEGMAVEFLTRADAVTALPQWAGSDRRVILLTGDIPTMDTLARSRPDLIPAVNLGGIHHAPGRTERLRYLYLTPDEGSQLAALEALGVEVTAQDLPRSTPVPLGDLLA